VQPIQQCCSTRNASNAPPAYGGGNFVDLSLRVKIIGAKGTLLAHRPDYIHGSTRLCGTQSYGVSIPFSERLEKAYKVANMGYIEITPGKGTGLEEEDEE
jgi:hypothetical protein